MNRGETPEISARAIGIPPGLALDRRGSWARAPRHQGRGSTPALFFGRSQAPNRSPSTVAKYTGAAPMEMYQPMPSTTYPLTRPPSRAPTTATIHRGGWKLSSPRTNKNRTSPETATYGSSMTDQSNMKPAPCQNSFQETAGNRPNHPGPGRSL